MRLPRLVLVVIATVGLGSISAFAAHLSLSTNKLGSGTTSVARCDNPANWSLSFAKNGSGQVNQITVGNIASTCINANLSLTSTDSSGGHVVSTSTPITITSSSVIVSLAASPQYPTDLTNVHVVVTGP